MSDQRVEGFDLEQYTTSDEASIPVRISADQFSAEDSDILAEVGVLLGGGARSGTYVMKDFHAVCATTAAEGLEMLPIAEALDKYPWLKKKYYWNAVSVDRNEITQRAARETVPEGYFIRVEKDAKVELPFQAALYMANNGIAQTVHNVIVLEENAELNLITGCVTARHVKSGIHFAITESYIGKNAVLINTMIHSWGPQVQVRPHVGTIVEEGGSFVSNYVSLNSGSSIISNPKTWLNGKGASAKYYTVILADKGSEVNTGGDVYLNAEETSAEIVHRGVTTGGSIFQGGLMIGNQACRAHVDCAGMILGKDHSGYIHSTPGVKAMHPDAQLSHEASIGKIAPEQIEYLMARGITENDAISMIIRGFLDSDLAGLGEELDARIAEIADLAGEGEK
ncbi:MAG: SufD family Fe-S cluster assembly protein [Anaerolineaceae bacterium]|nr:SufD family Fe-S cluster assembly protein [Anaerolineaceae bacterium]